MLNFHKCTNFNCSFVCFSPVFLPGSLPLLLLFPASMRKYTRMGECERISLLIAARGGTRRARPRLMAAAASCSREAGQVCVALGRSKRSLVQGRTQVHGMWARAYAHWGPAGVACGAGSRGGQQVAVAGWCSSNLLQSGSAGGDRRR